MRTPASPDPTPRLLPEGRRWGLGARSVLPYLALGLQARPGGERDTASSIRNPVFPAMDEVLRVLRERH